MIALELAPDLPMGLLQICVVVVRLPGLGPAVEARFRIALPPMSEDLARSRST